MVATIQDGTRQVIEGTKQKGVDGLNALMNTRMGKAVSFGLDTALAVSEYAVEYYLPPDDAGKKLREDELLVCLLLGYTFGQHLPLSF